MKNVVMKTLIFLICIVVMHSQKQGCSVGWFGSTCQYKCRCASNPCESDGSCPRGSRCQPGWFGPACQYADLAHGNHVTVQPGGRRIDDITDGNDDTCNKMTTTQSMTLSWDRMYLISWLRVHTNNVGLMPCLTVQFSNTDSTFLNVDCHKIVTVNSTAMDIFCDLNVPVNQVLLTGEAVKSFCSLYISGGRNVALHQHTSQSSTLTDNVATYGSEKAVDGDNSGDFTKKSCACTDGASDPFWAVNFSRPVTVYRYALYNRVNTGQSRLQGFNLASLDDKGSQVYKYTESGSSPEDVYTVVPETPTVSVSNINIRGVYFDKILTLCEVEIYGETECVAGRYGRECENTCNCANTSEQCYVSTGGCLSGCAAGYHGEDCTQRHMQNSALVGTIAGSVLGYATGIVVVLAFIL